MKRVKQLSSQQLQDLANLRHICNLLKTVVSSLEDRPFPTVQSEGIEAIYNNTQRALSATRNEISSYRIKE